MPLLKGRFMSPVQPLKDVDHKETIYTIPHTKEQFRSKEEYEKLLALYDDEVWTCQCTGQIKLSHHDAWQSERDTIKALKAEFPECYEKPVLEIVHHSSDVLDNLTDQAWRRLHEELSIGEIVCLAAGSNKVEGTIQKVSRTEQPAEGSTCSSPSSNKENTEDEDGSPKKRKHSAPSPAKKFVFPKLLPHKYSVKLKGQEKMVSGIPAQDITRLQKVPVKDILKTFIRSFAWRGGFHFNSPWAVNDELVKKYSLPNKLANIFLSPTKMTELGRKALEEKRKSSETVTVNVSNTTKKRKRTTSQDNIKSQSKKQKTVKSPQKQPTLSFNKSRGKKSPKKSVSPVKSGYSTPKKSPKKSSKKSPKKSIQNSQTESNSDESSDDDMTLAEIKNTPEKPNPKKSPAKQAKTATPSSTKRGRPSKDKSAKNKKVATTKNQKKNGKSTPKKNKSDKSNSKMKQVTLFDLKGKKKKDGSSTPKKSPSKSPKKSPFKIPPIAQRLQKALNKDNRPAYNQLLVRCAKDLLLSQIKQLPEPIKEPILQKREKMEEKKRLEKMSPAEKKEYMNKKKVDAKRKMRQTLKNKNKRLEDTDLVLKPLPTPKLVETPDGIANELFGDVAMVTEFISCYGELFTPEDDMTVTHITTDELLSSLVSDHSEYDALAKVLSTLLQTLVQDAIAEDYLELGIVLSEIPVNKYTVSELVRLCLRTRDQEEVASDESDEVENDLDMPDDLLERLETTELYDFNPNEKIQILQDLCHRIMCSYSVQDFMEQKQRMSAELWKERIAQQRVKNDKKKDEKQKLKEMKEQVKTAGRDEKQDDMPSEAPSSKKVVTLDRFYGGQDTKTEEGLTDSDMISAVKNRRLNSAKAAEERQKQLEADRQRREKEYEEYKKERDVENFEKRFEEGILAAKWSVRQTPLGSDRHHDRYWIFHKSTPGLFVEKGWAIKDVAYSVKPPTDSSDSDSSDSESDESDNEEASKGRPKASPRQVEKTIPHTGQNLWFVYNKMEDIDKLIKNLHPQGARESKLKEKLTKHRPYLMNLLKDPVKNKLDDLDPVDVMEGLREELDEMENRLLAGGLGGCTDNKAWDKQLEKAKTVEDFGKCLLQTQSHVYDRFLQGMMIKKVKRKVVKSEPLPEEDADKKSDITEEKEAKDNGEFWDFLGHTEEVAVDLEKWKEAVETSPTTFSRLHVLMGMLEASIKWEKSAENAKCKICRKKRADECVLLCDQCNQAFHLYCLRPALLEIPSGEWYCPACMPQSTRKGSRNRNYRELAGEDSDDVSVQQTSRRGTRNMAELDSSESEVEMAPIENEKECARCGGDEGIFPCSTCPSSFHLDCHDPPLRREPRSSWRCNQCTTGVRLKKTRRQATKKRKYTYDTDDDNYSTKPKRSCPTRVSSSRRGHADSDDDTPRRSSRTARKAPSRYEEYDTGEDEDEDSESESSSSSGSESEEEQAWGRQSRSTKASR